MASVLYTSVIFLFMWQHFVHCTVDEFMSCDRFFESRRKSRVLDLIPCDMSINSFCLEKGPGYPEGAIWKFKEENRALMRRLYGDLESTSVYREMRSSLSGPSSHMSRSAQGTNGEMSFNSPFSSLEYNIRVGSGLATVQSASEPVVSKVNPLGRTKVKKIMKKKKKQDSPAQEPQVQVVTSTTTSTSVVYATTSETPAPTTTTEQSRFQTTLQPTTVESEQMTTNTILPIDSMTTFDETIGQTTSETPTPGSPKTDNLLALENTETTANAAATTFINPPEATEDEIAPENLPLESKEGGANVNIDEIIKTVIDTEHDETFEYDEIIEEPATVVKNSENPEVSIYQQDEEAYDDEEIDYSGTAVNACPVKEEVFAPYWANNTRDQVLALLNLYPFEQYIHMETCKYEKEEMLCRRGCRCEQQYRLHRLLAFDPSNECRGIFSDWFRFPSYCICKCYNVPPEFVEKRRKPRIEPTTQNIEEEDLKESKVIDDETDDTIFRDSKVMQYPEDTSQFSNIPAILPYEAKIALLREIARTDQKEETETMPKDQPEIPVKKDRQLDSDDDKHFFYGNLPVMDYKLSDGSKGSVDQVPR